MATQMATEHRHWLATARYEPDEVRRLLEHWSLWHAGSQIPDKPFEEGGSIDRMAIATEGGFAALARQYGDLDLYTATLRQPEQAAMRLKWQYDCTKYQLARQLHKGDYESWEAAWTGTRWVLEAMTRDNDMRSYIRYWRESLHQKRK